MKKLVQNSVLLISVLAMMAGCPVQAADRVPNDTYYNEQWYLRQIGAPEAWNKSLGIESVIIAFIDSGVDIDHPDLKDNIWRNLGEIAGNGRDDDGNGYIDDVNGWDFLGNDSDPRPDITGDFTALGANHGTVGAGVAAARGDNGRGITGVSWQSTIMPLRALDSNGTGDGPRMARAVRYAVANGAKIINLSFVGSVYSDELRLALRAAYDSGVFIVAAAGNAPDGSEAGDLDKKPMYPICLDQNSDENFIYGVAATDEKDHKAEFSNYGAGCVDGSAPGVRILSTQLYRPGNKYFESPYGGFYNGTSVAAPIVSGMVALIRALDRNLTPKQITNILTDSSFKIDDLNPGLYGKLGRGRIDAAKAVDIALGKKQVVAQPTLTTLLLPPESSGKVIVAAPGAGRAPEIRLYTEDGSYVRSFMSFPESFKGGVSLSIGNFDRTKRNSIVAGAGPGGAPQVRIFDINTKPIGGFMAYNASFKGGVSVAAGDADGDGKDEIITGAGPGGGPHVRIFGANGVAMGGFFAFDARKRTGVDVAAGDLDGDGRVEIVASAPDSATVRIFDARGKLLSEISPFGKGVRRGNSRVTVTDLDGDGRAEITVTRIASVGLRLSALRLAGDLISEYDLSAAGGSKKLVGVMGTPPGRAPAVEVLGRAALTFTAFEPKFKGGVSAVLTE